MKILKGLLLISIASLVCIPLCFSSSFEKPSGVQNGSIRPAHLDSNGNSAISGECVIINASDNTAFDYVSCAGLETDPVFVASPSNGITAGHIANWNIAYAYGNHATAGYLTAEVDGSTTNELQNLYGIITTNSGTIAAASTNTSLGILGSGSATTSASGNEVIISVTETDPVFNASVAKNILASNATAWNAAYEFGNWQTQGFITSVNQAASYNWAGAVNNFFTNIQVPWGANPTVTTNGAVAIDTTDNQFLLYGNATYAISPERSIAITIPDLTSSDDNLLFWVAPANITLTKVGCKYRGTGNVAATISLLDDNNNAMTHGTVACVNSGTLITYVDITANNTIQKGEGLAMNVTNVPDPTTDDYTISCGYRIDRV